MFRAPRSGIVKIQNLITTPEKLGNEIGPDKPAAASDLFARSRRVSLWPSFVQGFNLTHHALSAKPESTGLNGMNKFVECLK